MLALTILLVVLLGYANQNGSTCAVLAVNQIIARRGYSKIAGFAVAAGIALLAAQLLRLAGSSPRVPGWAAVLGGAISALGASLNGRCAMGTIADLGTGNAARFATLAGFMAGASLALVLGANPAMVTSHHTMTIIPSVATMMLAMAAIVLGWRKARKHDGPSPAWMALIGALSVALMAIDTNWSYTSHLSAIAMGEELPTFQFATILIALVGGGVIAARRSGRWQPRVPDLRVWLRDGAGGILLGFGAALVPGSNDTMLLVGVPQLLPHLLLAYLVFLATLVLIQLLRKQHGKIAK